MTLRRISAHYIILYSHCVLLKCSLNTKYLIVIHIITVIYSLRKYYKIIYYLNTLEYYIHDRVHVRKAIISSVRHNTRS